ncbi:helix-turn-helix domain-containing protein [Clostridium sp. CCUG 7971]|uniref:helix-turn-helix domain-containing protein n=1 Tax=Clostridium sp. CCUG 7971 TaxID=2811414 RepID=UPI00336BE65B
MLPKELLDEILNYVDGELLYIPVSGKKQKWGENSGSRKYYKKCNTEIINLYKKGVSIIDIAQKYCLSYDSVRKIVRK